ncbi:putative ribonuclease H-like domain-containing protein [Tanacetum coccineum]
MPPVRPKLERTITEPLHTLHMDLFGPTSIKSINHASYCLVITDDCTRFSWVFFLGTKDETSGILQNFIRQIENQLNHRVKIIRSDNGTEFKNRDMLEFCGDKGIKQEYSNAKTPQQNRVAERMIRTLIEAARTMLADLLLPTTFWAKAVNTACYILNRVRVTKPQNKTPYELLFGHKPIISYIRPFGCHVTILDTLSVLGKFDGKCDEGFLVGYSLNSKAYRVYHLVTKKVEFNLHVNFLEEKPNIKGVGYRWMFDIDDLTDSMNYVHVSLDNQANPYAGMLEVTNSTGMSEVTNSAGISQAPNANVSEEEDEVAELIVIPTTVKHATAKVKTRKFSIKSKEKELHTTSKEVTPPSQLEDTPNILDFRRDLDALANKYLEPVPEHNTTSTPLVNTGSKHLQKQGIFDKSSYDEEGVVQDFNNLPSEVVTRSKVKIHSGAHALEEPKKISEALQDDRWVEAMQDELLQFKLQQVWILVDLPHGAKVIGTKWVFRNKKDARGVVVRNKARLVAQGYKQEEGVDYDEGNNCDEDVYVSSTSWFCLNPVKSSLIEYDNVFCQSLEGIYINLLEAWYATLQPLWKSMVYREVAIDKTLLVPALITKIDGLETELNQTKITMGKAIVKLVKKVKKLENILKSRRIVLSDSEDEEVENSSKQGRNLQKDMSKGYETPKQGTTSGNLDISPQEDISVGFDDINTASEVPLVSTEANISTASRTVTYSRRSAEKKIIKDKGKAIMTEPEPEKNKRKRQRATAEEESSKIDWNDLAVIRPTSCLRSSRINKSFEEMESPRFYQDLSEMLKDFDREDVKDLYRLVKERFATSRPEGYDLMLWGDLHTLFESNEEDEIWMGQHEYDVIS